MEILRQVAGTLITFVIFFVLLFLYTQLAGPLPFSVNSVTTTKSDSFTVNGTGKASIKPDLALVTVGVTATAGSVQAAQDQLNSNINKVSAAVKALGVDNQDIQTNNYSINPTYDYREGGQKITGYNANSNLTIKVRKIDDANKVVDAATANGANQVGGISFDAADKSKAESEAREKAVQEAKIKADQASKVAGFRLGKLINYNENFNGDPRPLQMAASVARDVANEKATQIEPGSSEIVVTVTLSYEIQ